MTSRLITPQLAEQFKQYPLYSQDGKKKNATRLLLLAFSCLQTWHEKSFRISSSDTSVENK